MQVSRADVKFPITPEILQAQSRLIDTLRKVKTALQFNRAAIVRRNNDYGGSVGDFCFFKIGELDLMSKRFDSSTAFMESIVWDIAVILKMSSHFVPTGLLRLNFLQRSIERPGAGNAMQVEEAFEVFNVNKTCARSAVASFQPAQAGRHLTLRDTVPDEEFATALTYSLVLGQYDHHFNNIIINRNNELFSFDNTLSLPGSKGFLNLWDQQLIRSIRPSLLGLKNGAKPLTFQLRELMMALLAKSKNELPVLKAYFSSYLVKKRLSCLKPGWFDVDKSIACLESRIALLENTLKNPKVKSLRDLVLSAFEDYRLTIAAQIINRTDCSADSVFTIDGIDMQKVLENLYDKGYSFAEFKALADNYTSYEEWFSRLRALKPKEGLDREWNNFIKRLIEQSPLEVKGDAESGKYLSKALFETVLKDSNSIFTNGFKQEVISLDGDIFPVDLISKPGKVIVKAYRGELPPVEYGKAEEGLRVLRFLKELDREKIPFKLVDARSREKEMFDMEPYSYYVEQLSSRDFPHFSIVYRTDSNPRIIPLKVLDLQVLKLLTPPRVKPLSVLVEIDGISYDANIDHLNRFVIKMYEGYLPRMTKPEFDEWVKGPKIERDILLTLGLFNNRCLSETEVAKAISDVEDYTIIQLIDKPGLVFKLLLREGEKILIYDLKIEIRPEDNEEVFTLTDQEGKAALFDQEAFRKKICGLD